ncbi:MAG: DUF1329 domain-containing protein, partial [Candidatus Limnocylindria bacterium]
MPPAPPGPRWLATLLAGAALASPAAGEPPPEGTCPALYGQPGAGVAEDASPTRLPEGAVVEHAALLALQHLLPEEVWQLRHAFFYDGMRLEIGACHRRYPTADFYAAATAQFAGKASLDADGNLHGYVAGLPFPPATIDPKAPDAAARWAWNFEKRYRGAGPTGHFRLIDFPSRMGAIQVYEGSFFLLQSRERADLAATDHAIPGADESIWIGGGRFDTPMDARHLAWHQIRAPETETAYTDSDQTFVYVPSMRKVRRAATTWVDGFFTPRYRVAGDGRGGGIPVGGGDYGPTDAIYPAAAESAQPSEYLRRGFVTLALRPNAYLWRLLGEREVLAPLNAYHLGYPQSRNRNYGPSGLSVASDRWDVRWAVVIEGRARQVADDVGYVRLWIDWQTGQPLYFMSDRPNRAALDIGIQVHRWSGDRPDYPDWPDLGRVGVFDPVA